MEIFSLIIPAFLAGILTFLAPCTLPLVPGYLAFISGSSAGDLKDPAKLPGIRKRVFLNGVMYVLGFSLIFILSACTTIVENIPDKFELQILEPMGGKINKPKDWLYRERHGWALDMT